ncbi:MAG: putative metal-dependent phosphoesterase, family [Planctomycetota bacterium]|nr:putative metal-dependent phosphoesterase, family [Planctomycetota bacterium]
MTRTGAADLHVHTTHSDGACSPCEVVQAAANISLGALAITDHDTISALAVARPEARRLGLELVGGIELTAEHEGRELHVLGYFVQDEAPELIAACTSIRALRDDRVRGMVDRLRALGLQVDLDAIRRTFPRATIGRRHLADWLMRSGQVTDRRQAFSQYLGDDGPVQVPKPRLPIAEAIGLIRRSGGVAALAHPPYDLRERTLESFVAAGLAAIEVNGPGVPKARGIRLRGWATRFDLVPVCGSDFHANDRPGRWLGSITTPAEDLDRLRSGCPSPQ